jgi:hypothetical protein
VCDFILNRILLFFKLETEPEQQPLSHSTPVKVEPEAAAKEEIPPEDAGVKASVNQEKPGRPRLHRRQQSLFLPSATRRSQVSTPNADSDFFEAEI